MAISVSDIKELMKSTGVGMMDCKKALVEADGDKEKALVVLREKGLATQAKKAGRVAAEGIARAFSAPAKKIAAVVEVNSETDFCAKNPEFGAFVDVVLQTVLEKNPTDVPALLETVAVGSDKPVKEVLQDVFMKIRENISIRRFIRTEGTSAAYTHGNGSVGVLVNYETDIADTDAVNAVAKDLAMQVCALSPAYLTSSEVPEDVIEQEKSIAKTQLEEDEKMKNKPASVIENIINGKIKKFYSENCLLEQTFVKDNEVTAGKYVENSAKALGGTITIKSFVRIGLGEGIEKKSDNFADEVAKMTGGN
ncbi:MAG: translation elongation factor Ts [Ruminococcus sp.]|jgi:elongation factor Ts|nr:translation elongation factor Ts [Ruminococcus sp.]